MNKKECGSKNQARLHSLCVRAFSGALLFLVSGAAVVFAQNNTTSYAYDALGRLFKEIYDNGVEKEYRYDAAGNRTEVIVTGNDAPVNDNIPTLGIGSNLIDLTDWPVGTAPAGPGDVVNWPTHVTYYNEARWTRVTGPGSSNAITAMETGQTEPDSNGGGTNATNYFTIDPTRAYEFSIYFRKHDLAYQNLYFGTRTAGMVRRANSGAVNTNPYFLAWSLGTQANYLDTDRWYKIVGYVLPEGYPAQSDSNWGGLYDVSTGARIANIANYRWNEDRLTNLAYARFFTYYSQAQQNTFTNYFYQPSVRVTEINYTPVVPSLSISHANAEEGNPIVFNVNLSASTTVTTKVNYSVSHPGGSGSASSGDYVASSGTLEIPAGVTQSSISVSTVQDTIVEGTESIRLTLSSPVRATIAETSELAYINDDDIPPSFSINNAVVSEGGTLTFTVTKANAASASHSVSYSTANGTALAGSDYSSRSGTLTFTSTQTSKAISVPTIEDTNYEPNETLYVNLSSPTGGATISDLQGVGTINNDDSANTPPNAVNDDYFFDQRCCSQFPNENLYVLNNDSDVDGDTLTIISVTQPPGAATATIVGNRIVFDFNINQSYFGTFTYTVSDGNGGTDTATVVVEADLGE